MLCPGCFQKKTDPSVCGHCGYDESLKRSPLVLAHHTLLGQDRYRVGRVIGKPGGFGITYLGWDERLLTVVAIKEYLPRDLSSRDSDHLTVIPHSGEDADTFAFGLTRFLEEAHTLARLDHANLVRVRDYFEANGTAYLVMDYYSGLTLQEFLERQPGGKLSEEQAIAVIMPILDGLREVHAKGFLHRDVKPQNIYLTTGNRPLLLDFGAARIATGERSRNLTVMLTEGYAPIEQYQRQGHQGPWTDVYGATATLYHLLNGQPPPTATDRIGGSDDLPGLDYLSPRLAKALTAGLAAKPAARTQSIQGLQALLLAGPPPPAVPIQQPLPVAGSYGWAVGLAVLAVLLIKAWPDGQPDPATRQSTPSPSIVRSPAPLPQAELTPDFTDQPLADETPPPPLPNLPAAPRTDQERAIADGERVRTKMRNQEGTWTAARYRAAYAAFKAAWDHDPARRNLWRGEADFALQMAQRLEPASSTPSVASAPAQLSAAARRALADGERVRTKMRNQEGEWTAARYRAAYAAFKAAEQAEPSRGAFWRAEQQHALDQAKSLEASAPQPAAPPPITPARNLSRRLTASAQQAIADGERVHSLMLTKDGDWTPIRYRMAIAAFKAAEKADPARKAQWRGAIDYAQRMADTP